MLDKPFNKNGFFVNTMSDIETISIVMPVKDTAKYLPECLDSILAQSFPNWELIVVNDHSSDSSLDILEKYESEDDRIHVYTNSCDGLLEALRYGYSKSTGNLIHRMDSDDKMPINKLQLMHNAWQKSGMGSIITGGTEYFTDEGEVGDGFRRYDAWLCEVAKSNTHTAEIYRECVIPSNCWLVHRNDFDRIGGFEKDVFPEDYDLCFRFYQGGLQLIGLPEVLHYWRDRPDRISRNWECYKDNRFFELKINYFISIERDVLRPLVLWGAGKNGKDLAKLILKNEKSFHWVCDNENKIGKEIYDIKLKHFMSISEINDPQLIIAVASPDGQKEIEQELNKWGLKPGQDYWFFA